MKTILITLAAAAFMTISTGARAGEDSSCHFHGNKPAAEAVVRQCAAPYKDRLVQGGKLEKSWQAVTKVEQMTQIDGPRSKEWKLSFKNPAATDKSKETLFLFYSLAGNLIAANHTGR